MKVTLKGMTCDNGLSAASDLLSMREAVFECWLASVRREIKGAAELIGPALAENLPRLYDGLAAAVGPCPARDGMELASVAAMARGDDGMRLACFEPDEVLREYQLFREAMREVARCRGADWPPEVWTFIGKAIEIASCEALREYVAARERMKCEATDLAHGMRAPLAVMAISAQLIERTGDKDVARRAAEKISRHAAGLGLMMGQLLNVLTLAPQDTPALALSSFDIRALALEVASEAVSDAPVLVNGDSVIGHWCVLAMRKALENLVANASKHGTGGAALIEIRERLGRMSLSVQNSGPPIDADQRERIFVHLNQRQNMGPLGWGVGLSFVRSVAEAHGGGVSVDSASNGGAIIAINVPVDSRSFVKNARICVRSAE